MLFNNNESYSLNSSCYVRMLTASLVIQGRKTELDGIDCNAGTFHMNGEQFHRSARLDRIL